MECVNVKMMKWILAKIIIYKIEMLALVSSDSKHCLIMK